MGEGQRMKNLYTYKEIKDKIKSNDYNAEMLLMHLLLNFEKLEKERDEAREEAEIVRALYSDATGITGTFPWDKDSK